MNICEHRQRRVLIVDDIEDNRVLLERALQSAGYRTKSAENGMNALACLSSEAFDIVLLDWMMPGLSGLETLHIIRQTHDRNELPVIMCTAVGEDAHVVDAMEAGANDYVLKPISLPVLRARMTAHLLQSEEISNLAREKHESSQRLADQMRRLWEARTAG